MLMITHTAGYISTVCAPPFQPTSWPPWLSVLLACVLLCTAKEHFSWNHSTNTRTVWVTITWQLYRPKSTLCSYHNIKHTLAFFQGLPCFVFCCSSACFRVSLWTQTSNLVPRPHSQVGSGHESIRSANFVGQTSFSPRSQWSMHVLNLLLKLHFGNQTWEQG